MSYKEDANENSDLVAIAQEIDMKTALQTAKAPSAPHVQAIEDMLDDLELDSLEAGESDEIEETIEATGETEIVENVVETAPVSDEELEAAVDIEELDIALEREETYSAQESETKTVENASEATASAKNSKSTKSAAPRASTPRTPRDLNSVDPVFFVLEGDAGAMSQTDLDANKQTVLNSVPTQKKIAEKFENLFLAISVNKQPSVYVKQAFKLLEEKKTVSSADIVGMFKGSYSQGTAQSQAGQIMTLFAAVKIAERQKNTLVLNENSVVAAKLREIYANGNNASTAGA